jgi:hypothetical protein
MHVDVDKPSLASFKDFGKHYLMIVLSILTALGLEAWIEHSHHNHAAERSRERMDQELSGVIKAMQQAEQVNEKSLSNLKSLDAVIAGDLAAGVDTGEISRRILARKNEYTLNTNWPTLTTNAWDVAVADQSIGWIDSASLQRYSAAYSAERTLNNWLLHDSTVLIDAPRLIDTVTELQLDHPVDPNTILRSLRQMEGLLDTTIRFLRNTAEEMTPAVRTTPAAGGSGTHP